MNITSSSKHNNNNNQQQQQQYNISHLSSFSNPPQLKNYLSNISNQGVNSNRFTYQASYIGNQQQKLLKQQKNQYNIQSNIAGGQYNNNNNNQSNSNKIYDQNNKTNIVFYSQAPSTKNQIDKKRQEEKLDSNNLISMKREQPINSFYSNNINQNNILTYSSGNKNQNINNNINFDNSQPKGMKISQNSSNLQIGGNSKNNVQSKLTKFQRNSKNVMVQSLPDAPQNQFSSWCGGGKVVYQSHQKNPLC